MAVLAFDFGGTKLAAAVVDPGDGRLFSVARRPTPQAGGAFASLEAMAQAGAQALDEAGCRPEQLSALGVSFGGPVSRDRRSVLRSMHVPAWEGVDLLGHLEQHFGRPAFLDNDANAAALGEWRFGRGQGRANLLYVQVSTGIGAGLVLNGAVYRGAGLAGEFGHIPLEAEGPRCSCGKRGCLESFASGWALARSARRLLEDGRSARLARLAGGDPGRATAEHLLRAAAQGDPAAQQAAEAAFSRLAQGIAMAICLLDPELVILGGGVTRSREWIAAFLPPQIDACLPPLLRGRVPYTFAGLEGRETLVGAALLPGYSCDH